MMITNAMWFQDPSTGVTAGGTNRDTTDDPDKADITEDGVRPNLTHLVHGFNLNFMIIYIETLMMKIRSHCKILLVPLVKM